MRPLNRFSEASEEACIDSIIDIVLRVIDRLRAMGFSKGTSEAVDAVKLISTYAAVRGKDLCSLLKDYNELSFVIRSLLAKRDDEDKAVSKALAEVMGFEDSVMDGVERDLKTLGLGFGRKIARLPRMGTSEFEAYSRLKLLGFIRRSGRYEKVVPKSEATRLIGRLSKRYRTYAEAIKAAMVNDIRRGGFYAANLPHMISGLDLSSVSSDTLLAFTRRLARNGNINAAVHVANELVRRILRGDVPDNAWEAYRLLDSLNLMDKNVAVMLASRDPSIARKKLTWLDENNLREVFRRLDHKGREKLFRGLLESAEGVKTLEELVSTGVITPFDGLHSSRTASGSTVLNALITLSQAYGYLIEALSRGDQAYLDMAAYLASRVRDILGRVDAKGSPLSRYYREFIALLNAYANGEDVTPYLKGLLSGAPVASVVRTLHKLYSSPDPRIRLAARKLLMMVASRLRWEKAPRGRRVWLRRGRLCVRRALRLKLFLTNDYNVAFTKMARERVVLVLDKSGSMKPYSAIAALAASSFLASVSAMVIFDSDVYIVPKASQIPLTRLLDIILGVDFEGYTDVASAVALASKTFRPGKMIVISDLHQTVENNIKVNEAFKLAVKRGWKVYVIAPPTVEKKAVEGIRGVKLEIVFNENELMKVLRRLFT